MELKSRKREEEKRRMGLSQKEPYAGERWRMETTRQMMTPTGAGRQQDMIVHLNSYHLR